MKNTRIAKTAALLALLTAGGVPGSAFADKGWEIGAAVGNVHISENLDEFQFEDDGTAYRFFGGYNFSSYFGLEAGYLNIGSFRDNIDVGGELVEVTAEADGFTFAAKGMLPLGEHFTAEARFGFFFYDGQSTVAGITENDPSDQNPYAGLGLSYHLSDHIDLDLGFDYFDLDDIEPWMASLGISVRF